MSRTTSVTTLRQPAELVAHGLAPAADLADLERVAARYAIAVTPDIADLIDSEDPDDPIARQFIPNARELVEQPGESADPIGDDAHSPGAGRPRPRDGHRAEGGGGNHLAGHSRQPSARAEPHGPRRGRPPSRCRHSPGEPVSAAARRQ